MKTKRALFFSGGWAGHQPDKIVQLFVRELQAQGFETTIETTLESLADAAKLKTFSVIFPCWTMGQLTPEQSKGLDEAVRSGVGLAGIHGGMGDAFRGNGQYEWMVGGHFVGHPHVGDYTVCIKDFASPITRDLPGTFPYRSEQYYMLMDPAVHVLADSQYLHAGRACTMPVVWTKTWGNGRVFYNALGHDPDEFTQFPAALTLTTRGVLWAAGAL
jgi:type 1 glutamine amidotransferase